MTARRRRTFTAGNLGSLPPGDYTDDNKEAVRSAVPGLTLRVSEKGRRWALRYTVARGTGRGPQRRLPLGKVDGPLTLDLEALGLPADPDPKSKMPWPPKKLGLTEARQVAKVMLGLAARGVDPAELLAESDRQRARAEAEEHRRRDLGTATLGALLDRYLDLREDPPKGSHERPVRPNTMVGWRGLGKPSGAIGPLRDLDPATLTAGDVRRWHSKTGAERGRIVANRALELLRVLFAWGMRTEDETGEPLLAASPCDGVRPFEERPRSRTLSSDELRAVWQALEGEVYGDVLRLLLWTGARKSEATGAEWSEIDLPARLWTVPAERSKTGAPRRIPLSSPAVAMLRNRRAADPTGRWVFPSPTAHTGAVRSVQALVRRVQERSQVTGWCVHDLRRCVRTQLAALAVAREVGEFILGHLAPKLERTYNLHEPLAEAASALEAWAQRLASYVAGEEPDAAKVVPLARPARRT